MIATVPLFMIAPPPDHGELLPENVLFVTVIVPLFIMAPPWPLVVLFSVKVLFVIASVPALKIPPPWLPVEALPLAIVKSIRVRDAPALTKSTRSVVPPEKTTACPVPSIVSPAASVMFGRVEPSGIVPLTLKVIVSAPEAALASVIA